MNFRHMRERADFEVDLSDVCGGYIYMQFSVLVSISIK